MKSALVVDGEPPIRELLQEVLKAEGMEAVTMASGSEAAEFAHAQKFDVVFVDSSSPVSDGIELTPKNSPLRLQPQNAHRHDQQPEVHGLSYRRIRGRRQLPGLQTHRPHQTAAPGRVTQGAIDNEIRRFRRVPVEVKAAVRCGADEVDASTVDLSLNGALLRARRIFRAVRR